jgi:hypothetical protein
MPASKRLTEVFQSAEEIAFDDSSKLVFFCVHPRCITGIEVYDGEIELIKWWVRPDDESGVLRVARETKVGPKRLRDFFGDGER